MLLNKDTFEYDISCTPLQIPCALRCASGGYRQVPKGTRPVVLIVHGRKCSHQQRVRQAEVRVHRVVAARRGPVPQARCGRTHRGLGQGRQKGKHHPAILNAEPLRWMLPSTTRTSRGLQVALHHCGHCGVLAAKPTAKSGPTAVASLSSLSRSHSGSSYAMVPSMLSQRPSGSKLPVRPGIMSNGSTSSSQDANAGAMYPHGFKVAPEKSCFTPRSEQLALQPVDETVITRHSGASPWNHQARPRLLDSRGGCTA